MTIDRLKEIEFRKSVPAAPELMRRMRNMEAVRSAILLDEYFPFYREITSGEVQVFTYDDGGGNGFDLIHSPQGSLFLGSDHEADFGPFDSRWHITETRDSEEGWQKQKDEMFRGLPNVLLSLMDNASFCTNDGYLNVTVALWRLAGDNEWSFSESVVPSAEYDSDGLTYFINPLLQDFRTFFNITLDDYGFEEEELAEEGTNVEKLIMLFEQQH